MSKNKKILVAMSGGVDSSVAAMILKNEGFNTAGVTMCFESRIDRTNGIRCLGADAVNNARKTCGYLGIPHYFIDYSRQFREKIIKKFIGSYIKGKTPNPCIDCNRHLKFELLLNYAKNLGFDYFATGHYAKILENSSGFYLARAKDRQKDQSYFLYVIKRSELGFIKLPLGDYDKNTVRKIALEAGLPAAHKEESQDICFLDNDYRDFLLSLKPGCRNPGDIIDKEGNVLGRHRGVAFYTIGQRKGLGISSSEPLYVTDMDAGRNLIIAGSRNELKSRGLVAGDLNLLVDSMPSEATVKIRYQSAEVPCNIRQYKKSSKVLFDEAQEAVTPGQSAVFYKGDKILGGGIIKRRIK